MWMFLFGLVVGGTLAATLVGLLHHSVDAEERRLAYEEGCEAERNRVAIRRAQLRSIQGTHDEYGRVRG